jgi:lipid A disaccharide synthetase
MLYQSSSGVHFLSTLRDDQQKMIMDYINPEQWAIKFKRDSNMVEQVKELLNAGGY